MRNLLDFIIKHDYCFLFILLEATAIVLLMRFNNYQQSVLFSSANAVAGSVYRLSGEVKSYFHLREDNAVLLERNILLEQRLARMERVLKMERSDSLGYAYLEDATHSGYDGLKALVINNSIDRNDNYITIDKGSSDGIRPEMAVVGAGGVVGVVYRTSANYSLVIPLLNGKSNLSCKIAKNDYFGYLNWEGHDPSHAYLRDLPRHAEFSIGDTIVTSGFSTMFPEGLMVGTIDEVSDSHDGLSYRLRVHLSADFGNLTDVRVLMNRDAGERMQLERQGGN